MELKKLNLIFALFVMLIMLTACPRGGGATSPKENSLAGTSWKYVGSDVQVVLNFNTASTGTIIWYWYDYDEIAENPINYLYTPPDFKFSVFNQYAEGSVYGIINGDIMMVDLDDDGVFYKFVKQ